MSWIDLVLSGSLGALALALVTGFVRVVRGPCAADRLLALDFLTMLGIAIAALIAAATHRALFLDIAIVLALISFIGTVAAATYIEKKSRP
jgi:multicomponent Na+:H+ antiporter subunit F